MTVNVEIQSHAQSLFDQATLNLSDVCKATEHNCIDVLYFEQHMHDDDLGKAAYEYCYAYTFAQLAHCKVPDMIVCPYVTLSAMKFAIKATQELTFDIADLKLLKSNIPDLPESGNMREVQDVFRRVMQLYCAWQVFKKCDCAIDNGIMLQLLDSNSARTWGPLTFHPEFNKMDAARKALDIAMIAKKPVLCVICATDFYRNWFNTLSDNADAFMPWWFTSELTQAKVRLNKPLFDVSCN